MLEPVGYSKNLGQFVSAIQVLFKRHNNLLKWHHESESIMDIGIGDGRMANEVFIPSIPKNVKEYIGCDFSVDMLESSKRTITSPKFKTFQMDITTETVPIEMRNRFHHIFSCFLFHLIPNVR